jgi:hypothetical protein
MGQAASTMETVVCRKRALRRAIFDLSIHHHWIPRRHLGVFRYGLLERVGESQELGVVVGTQHLGPTATLNGADAVGHAHCPLGPRG